METKNILLIVFPILTGTISSYLTYYFAIKSKRDESILKFKEEKYSNLLILLQGFVGVTTSSEKKVKFFEEQYKSWLYSSDDVVKSINEMIELVKQSHGSNPKPYDGRKAIGNIVLAMRKDMLGKTNLTNLDFQYTDVIKPGTEK
jgi:hypothetical protein